MGKEMTRTYSAADFANARFAEDEDGFIAARLNYDPSYPWVHSLDEFTDADMSRQGWVPVSTKPVLTESEVKKMVGNYEVDDFAAGFAGGFRYAGGEVIPDPEPTNTDKLEELIISAPGNFEGVEAILKRPANVRAWAEYLNEHGVTAPNVKGN